MDVEGQSFDVLAQLASNSLYDLSSRLRKVRKIISRADSAAVGREMASLGSQCASASKVVDAVSVWPANELQASEKKLQTELGNELDSLMRGVRQIQALVTDRLRMQQKQQQHQQKIQQLQTHPQNQQENYANRSEFSEQTPLLPSTSGLSSGRDVDGQTEALQQEQRQQLQQQEEQLQVLDELDQADVDLHGALVSDRDAEIAEIQRGMREINSIFQDVGVLVAQQGQQLDTVEDNLADIAQHAEGASRQLVKAENYQRGRGKWTCIALLVLLVITILVALSVIR